MKEREICDLYLSYNLVAIVTILLIDGPNDNKYISNVLPCIFTLILVYHSYLSYYALFLLFKVFLLFVSSQIHQKLLLFPS
jgi:hypothetical protein